MDTADAIGPVVERGREIHDTATAARPTRMALVPLSRPPIGRVPLRGALALVPAAVPHASHPTASEAGCPHARAGHCAAVAPCGGIDEIDTRILRILQSEGRISNLKLAASLGVVPGVARERVRRLTREGYILGYEAVIDPCKLSAGMLVFTKVRLEKVGLGVTNAFRAAVQVRPEILECHEVAGDFDYLIKTRAADIDAYRAMLASLIWSLPGVRDTRTYAVMEEVKSSAHIPL